ncbi:SEC-C metal-binding domain-containing protein [Gimesia chilikensis]|uniref:SEC-C metal-binding domain-containing protein n=1 Tax=Gimesia TaxID=1649453 RepID=UPI0011A447A1
MSEKPKRNAPCICGSGKKYKKCCLPHIGNRRKDLLSIVNDTEYWQGLSKRLIQRINETDESSPVEFDLDNEEDLLSVCLLDRWGITKD